MKIILYSYKENPKSAVLIMCEGNHNKQ